MKKISREQAASAGHTKFYTGKPCNAGHVAQRWIISGSCIDCDRMHSRNGQAKKRKSLKAMQRKSSEDK